MPEMSYQELELVLNHNPELMATFHVEKKGLICRFFRKKAGVHIQLERPEIKKLLSEAKKKARQPNFKL